MRPLTLRIAGAIATALLLLSLAGSVAYADEYPIDPQPTAPADPGYVGE